MFKNTGGGCLVQRLSSSWDICIPQPSAWFALNCLFSNLASYYHTPISDPSSAFMPATTWARLNLGSWLWSVGTPLCERLGEQTSRWKGLHVCVSMCEREIANNFLKHHNILLNMLIVLGVHWCSSCTFLCFSLRCGRADTSIEFTLLSN